MRPLVRQVLEQEVVTLAELAKIMKKDQSNLRKLLRSGKIPAVKRGSVWIVDRKDIV